MKIWTIFNNGFQVTVTVCQNEPGGNYFHSGIDRIIKKDVYSSASVYAPLAQLVEQLTLNRQITAEIPHSS
jgi:hypothetical protein